MIDPWPDRTFRIFPTLAAFCAVILLLGAEQGRAEGHGVFSVRGVKVDVTAASTAVARDKALEMGGRIAFRRLLERLTLRADHGRLPEFSAKEITAFVLDFSVADEKASAVRYLASLNYSFRADEVRRLLMDLSIRFAETPSKPVLVLPVYQAAGSLLLWDDPNPWRQAWSKRGANASLVPTLLPEGDLRDIAAIGPEQAVAGDDQRLAAISARYQAGDTIVAHGILSLDRGRPDLRVQVTRYGPSSRQQTVSEIFRSADTENLEALLTRAAAELTGRIEDNWKRENLLQFEQQAVIAVTVPISGLADWLEIRNRLAGVAVIRRSDLIILSLEEARVNLHYIGGPEQLALALQQADMIIKQDGDGWVLELGK